MSLTLICRICNKTERLVSDGQPITTMYECRDCSRPFPKIPVVTEETVECPDCGRVACDKNH